jgi:integrase
MPRALTQNAIARMRPGDYLSDAAEPGLRVDAFEGRKSFLYRYRDRATRSLRQVTIGDASVVSIGDAREQVRALKRARKSGSDPRLVFNAPAEEKVVELAQAGYTVRALVDDYCRVVLAPTKRGAERERMLRGDLAAWYAREAARVQATDVKTLIAEIAKRAPYTSGKVLRELRAAYREALDARRLPEGTNPAAVVKAPRESRYRPRERAFLAGEWRTFLRWLPKSGMSRDVQDALLLISYTACRPGEATKARWSDIDLSGSTWTIRERKGGDEHLVFLSTGAKAILRARAPEGAAPKSEHVFPSPRKPGRAIREHALVLAIANARASSRLAHWTAHDLRRSAATLMQAKGVRFEVVRRVLGHYSRRNPTDIYAQHAYDKESRAAWNELGRTITQWRGK